MEDTAHRAIAIVGVGAVLPDAINAEMFWQNVKNGRYSVTEVPPDRWDPALYWDPDPNAPDKAYSKIGGWVREHTWDPMKWHLPIPPRVAEGMDDAQKWAVSCTRQALDDYGYPARPLDTDRTAVILGNAMAGERQYLTSLRLFFPEFERELQSVTEFAALPAALRREITAAVADRMKRKLPAVTEDTMPGELANCMAGRIANVFNFHGPNYVTDAACASAMAAVSAAAEGLIEHEFDVAVTGGIDRNMGAPTFIKFCKIGALSATGTRPYADGADGFVMGEGAAVFILKRLADAEKSGDEIYAVLRGIGGSSDGKGKGITAPNPLGQKLCLERAWANAGLSPATATMIEGHGTSTRVGDVVEVNGLAELLRPFSLPKNSVALGSVKSNIGHLKGAAGAAGLLKVALSLHEKVLPPSIHCETPNPGVDFTTTPLYVNGELRPWTHVVEGVRRAGVSAFGFGGTNFHAVLEEYMPGRLTGNGKHSVSLSVNEPTVSTSKPTPAEMQGPANVRQRSGTLKRPLRGALVVGAASKQELTQRLQSICREALAGIAPPPAPPLRSDLRAAERIVIDYGEAEELADRAGKALKALTADQPATWKALRAQGIFRGSGAVPGKIAFLYTGQGSQYVNMLKALRETEPLVADTFAEADRIMTPLLGRRLSEYVFVDANDPAALSKSEADLRRTVITQPAVLATDAALTRLLGAYGVEPDMAMGHSLGEYGALVAAGSLRFDDALEAVSARGREMTRLSIGDNGKMAAVFAPIPAIEKLLAGIDGYVVIANINSNTQAVIGGESTAVQRAVDACLQAGFNAVPLEVSHAFHTSIVAPASVPLRQMLDRLELKSPRLPVVANINGEFYPTGPDAPKQMIEILAKQVAAPVQFIKGLQTLYEAGARIFVEVGPKKALQGFAEDVLGDKGDVVALFTNHPKVADVVAFNQALCGLYAAGVGDSVASPAAREVKQAGGVAPSMMTCSVAKTGEDKYAALGHLLAEFLDRSRELYDGGHRPSPSNGRPMVDVTITGAALGLPGSERIFDDRNIARILRGEQFIKPIPAALQSAILDKNITRLVKSDSGGPVFEAIRNQTDVIKLAGRGGAFDPEDEFGIPSDRLAALDRVTQLAVAAGIEALCDAGIPLVMHYKITSKGTKLPERWGLPDSMRDDTGIIFASCWPGSDSLVEAVTRYHEDRSRREKVALLQEMRTLLGATSASVDLEQRIRAMQADVDAHAFAFDRRFLFRTLAMGHSQFAELIGARGPNTQVNSACASTTQAISFAEDWIREGRCRRVVIISADDVTSDNLMEWIGAGFLATGAAATDEDVREAALPFDKRRHGTILGMGASGIVVETADSVCERGLRPVCQVLSTATANSAFHGTRLDVQHICAVMEQLVSQAERRSGISRGEMARSMVFVSHETYTPARGGSAAAEIEALRSVFGADADKIVIANTKGFTGHAMGVGIEDVVAVKALESGVIPPVANYRDRDPELGNLNLSTGGSRPVDFALRLGAGFGSQISMSLLHWVNNGAGQRPSPEALGYAHRIIDANAWSGWLREISGDAAPEVEVVRHTLRVKDGKSAQQLLAVAARREPEIAPAPAAVVAAPEEVGVPRAADPVREGVLALVAEATGYPPDMLALDLDLEADLGVDTVKQAEIFASVRGRWGIARDENLKLRDFPTLNHVIAFVKDRTPQSPAVDEAEQTRMTAQPINGEPTDSGDLVKEQVLELVCEKTGYPKDMLALDLDLEADLGVDTVKQAELFAAIRSIYEIPRDENLKLRDFPTLQHVIGFVKTKRPDLAAAPPASAGPVISSAQERVKEQVLDLVCEKTGYPKDMLDLDLDLEADLGVDTVKQAELFAAIRGIYDIPRDENLKLRDFPTLNHVIGFVLSKRPELEGGTADSKTTPDSVQAAVLAIVARQTGYPTEMLDLDLDLESDLGIDTVKQAEMFASVRNAFQIPRDENLKLRDFPTLSHVIAFARERQGMLAPAAVTSSIASEQAPAEPVLASFEAAGQIPRLVPVPVARPALDLCKRTGIELGAPLRVIVAPDKGGVAEALTEELRKCGVQVLTLTPDSAVESLLAGQPVQGVYWLPALDDEGPVGDMSFDTWKAGIDLRVKRLYSTMRALYEQFAQSGTFLVSAVRLGGQHGYNSEGATAPMGGAVTGFTKTFKRECPNCLVKSVDFEPSIQRADIAAALIAETLRDPGAVEIGYRLGQRWTVALREADVADGWPAMSLNQDSVFVITGAAGSIVSSITADLAAASRGTFYLLDLVAEPDPSNLDLRRFDSDKEELKRDLARRLQARGERPTPVLIERELAGLERSKAALNAIEAIHAAGGTAHYISVDMRNGQAVSAAVERIRSESGHIDVLLHAAGLERSHVLPDKEPSEFDLVFDVKADGWFHLLHAIGDMPLGATVVFSSIAGRFGNAGQADYASANDLLCKMTSSFRRSRPDTRAVAIDWTAWGGIGMATRGSIPKMMERTGIDMLPPEAGIPYIRRELTSGGFRGEVVIAQRLGVLMEEWDSSGGLDTAAVSGKGPVAGTVTGCSIQHGIRVETTLDPRQQPFLNDHRIEGMAVLPGVMGLEAFAEAATCILPGWNVVAIEDVDFLAPFKFYRDEARVVTVDATLWGEGDEIVACCRLTGSRILAAQSEPQVTTHFTGRVRLSKVMPARIPPLITPPAGPSSEVVGESGGIYSIYFHGPAYRVLDKVWRDSELVLGSMASQLPPNHMPAHLPLLTEPRLTELCFQTAGIAEIEAHGSLGLPQHIDEVRYYVPAANSKAPYCAVVSPHPSMNTYDAQVVEGSGSVCLQVRGYRTIAFSEKVDTAPLKAMAAAPRS